MRKIAALIISGLLIVGGAIIGNGLGLGPNGAFWGMGAAAVIISWAMRADYAQWEAVAVLLLILLTVVTISPIIA